LYIGRMIDHPLLWTALGGLIGIAVVAMLAKLS
jgi:hypothetical protein